VDRDALPLRQPHEHPSSGDDCFGWAAQLAYYLLFALSPFLLFLTTLLGNLPIPQLLDRIMVLLAQVQPGDALEVI
jgi:membrane protein